MPPALTVVESKTLLILSRAGKLYEIERWIPDGKSIITDPTVRKTPFVTAIGRSSPEIASIETLCESNRVT